MFDLESFRKAEFKPREEEIHFEALEEAGLGSGKIKVRGLTALEIAQAEEESQKGKLLSDLVLKLASSSGKEKAAALLEGVGVSDDVPALLAKRYEHVRRGVVDPEMTLQDAIRLGEVFPIEFTQLANKIIELTGLGQQAQVKQRGSGKSRK